MICILSGFIKNPPIIPTTGKTYKTIIKKVSERIKECELNDTFKPFKVVDAGCGFGTLIVPLAKKFPQHQFIGIEHSYIPFWIAKFRGRRISNMQIIHQDIFDYDFKDISFVICFLLPSIMDKFTKKCLQELQKKSYIFSNRFKLVGLEPFETIDLGDNFSYIYLYEYLPTKDNKIKTKSSKS